MLENNSELCGSHHFLPQDKLVEEYQLGERPFAPGPVQSTSLATPTRSPKKRSFSQSSLDSFLKVGQSGGTPQKKKKKLSLILDKDSIKHKQQKGRTPTPKKPERKWTKEMLKKMLKRKSMTPKRKEKLENELKKIVEVEKEQRKAVRDAERERTKEKRQKVGRQEQCACSCASCLCVFTYVNKHVLCWWGYLSMCWCAVRSGRGRRRRRSVRRSGGSQGKTSYVTIARYICQTFT